MILNFYFINDVPLKTDIKFRINLLPQRTFPSSKYPILQRQPGIAFLVVESEHSSQLSGYPLHLLHFLSQG